MKHRQWIFALGLWAALVLSSASRLPAQSEKNQRRQNPQTVSYQVYGHVLEVLDATHVVVNRGRAEGLSDSAAEVPFFPVRKPPGGKATEAEFFLLLARGHVEKLDEHTATIELTVVAEPMEPGDGFSYKLSVPAGIPSNLLFALAARDITFTKVHQTQPVYTLSDVLRDPSAPFREALIANLLQEVHDQAELAKEVYKQRVEGGHFHGKTLSEAFLETKKEDVETFLRFVVAFPGRYMTHEVEFVASYAVWIVYRTPTDARHQAEGTAATRVAFGDAAAGRGDFAAAEAHYRVALKLLPDYAPAKEKLAGVNLIRSRAAMLATDPDDTDTRWKQMVGLFNVGAYTQAAAELDRLEKAGYDPHGCAKYRAYIAVRLRHYDEGIALLRALIEDQPDPNLDNSLRYAEALKWLKAEPDSAAALLEMAKLYEFDHVWNSATANYAKAYEAAQTLEQRAEALAGQKRVAALRKADINLGWAKDAVREYRLSDAAEKTKAVLELCKEAGQSECASKRVGELAEVAYGLWLTDFAIELRKGQVRMDPRNVEAYVSLGWYLYRAGRREEALDAFEAALRLRADDKHALKVRGRVRLAMGELAGARDDAQAAAGKDKKYAAPRRLLAQLAAAEGRYDEALRWAREAHTLDPDESAMQSALRASYRAVAARAEIAAGHDVPRSRLRLVRSLLELGLPGPAQREALQLTGTPYFGDANWAVATADWFLFPGEEQLAAARTAGAGTPARQRVLRVIEARAALRQAPDDPARRVALAQALVATGTFKEALAAVAGLLDDAKQLEARDVAELARQGLKAEGMVEIHLHYGEAAAMFRKIGVPAAAIRASRDRGSRGRHQEALKLLEPVLAEARADGDPLLIYSVELRMARLQALVGTLDAEAAVLPRGLEVCGALDDEYCLAVTHGDLVSLAYSEGRLSEAIREAEKARELALLTGSGSLARTMLVKLGDMKQAANDLDGAQAIAKDLLKQSLAASDAQNQRRALMLEGAVAMRRGDVQTARARYADVYQLGQRSGTTRYRAEARWGEAQALLEGQHDPKAAAPVFQKAADLYRRIKDAYEQGRALLGLGQALSEAGEDLDRARQVLGQALEIFTRLKRPLSQGSTDVEIALLEVRAGRAKEALEAAQDAVKIADAADEPQIRWEAHYAMARALEKMGKDAEAAAEYDTALDIVVKTMNRVSAADRGGWLSYGRPAQILGDAMDLNLRLKRPERAVEIRQLLTGLDRLRFFSAQRIQAQDEELQKLQREVAEKREQVAADQKAIVEEKSKPPEQQSPGLLAQLSRRKAANEGQLRVLMTELRDSSKNGAQYDMMAIREERLHEMVRKLPEGVLVVEYFTPDKGQELYALFFARGQERVGAQEIHVSRDELENTVTAYLEAVKRGQPQALELGAKLYDWLLKPVEEKLEGQTVLLVPFGPLHHLPFHALARSDKDGKPQLDQDGNPQYAIERYRIAYLSSRALSGMFEEHKASTQSLLALAPDASLKEARSELERMRKLPFEQVKVLYERDATAQSFRELAPGYRIVHFATHGVLAQRSTDSYLKMAGEERLTLGEVTGYTELYDHTDLVVLSACDSANQKALTPGHELISLADAFGAAGAPALVATLWQVDSAAAGELMVRFYGHLRGGKDRDTLEALRQAQMDLMRTEKDGKRPYAAPVYWAAFKLIGDFR